MTDTFLEELLRAEFENKHKISQAENQQKQKLAGIREQAQAALRDERKKFDAEYQKAVSQVSVRLFCLSRWGLCYLAQAYPHALTLTQMILAWERNHGLGFQLEYGPRSWIIEAGVQSKFLVCSEHARGELHEGWHWDSTRGQGQIRMSARPLPSHQWYVYSPIQF